MALPCFSPTCGYQRPLTTACRLFSFRVTHSRFSTRLSHLIPFLWLTSWRGEGCGPTNASRTSRCTTLVRCVPSEEDKRIRRYPFWLDDPARISPERLRPIPMRVRTLPPLRQSERSSFFC